MVLDTAPIFKINLMISEWKGTADFSAEKNWYHKIFFFQLVKILMSSSNWKPLRGSFYCLHSSEENCFKPGFGFASFSFI